MILVTGAAGNVGRRVVDDLAAAGLSVRALVRSAGAADRAAFPASVEVVVADLGEASSLEDALRGVEAVFLVWALGDATLAPAAVAALARRTRRVVYLSTAAIRDDLERQEHPLSAMHVAVERAIEDSGMGWTILRATKFATNTLAWAPRIREAGVVPLTYPSARRSPIHQRDIAAVASRALIEPTVVGERLVLSGPDLLTEFEQVHLIGEAIGRPVGWTDTPPDAARREMLAEGVAPELVDAALAFWARLVTHPEPVTDAVERLTGRRAATFHEWATEHADRFR